MALREGYHRYIQNDRESLIFVGLCTAAMTLFANFWLKDHG